MKLEDFLEGFPNHGWRGVVTEGLVESGLFETATLAKDALAISMHETPQAMGFRILLLFEDSIVQIQFGVETGRLETIERPLADIVKLNASWEWTDLHRPPEWSAGDMVFRDGTTLNLPLKVPTPGSSEVKEAHGFLTSVRRALNW